MKFTKFVAVLLVFMLTFALVGCGSSESDNNSDASADTGLDVAMYVNGNFGDNGYFDGLKAGMEKAIAELDINGKMIEGGTEVSAFGPGIESLAQSGEYDVIISFTGQTSESVLNMAPNYPDQDFFLIDVSSTEVPDNVYEVTYKQGEGSYLAGIIAAYATTRTDLFERSNDQKVVGAIGNNDNATIRDFMNGFTQGVHSVDPEIEVITTFVGSATDVVKAKELATTMFKTQGVDVVFNIAASAGLGILEAADELGYYAIGVDINQNGLYPGTVLTSVLKDAGLGIYQALEQYKNGTLEMGTSYLSGASEGTCGIAKDEYYEEIVPEEIRQIVEDTEQKIINGEIVVESDRY